MKALRRYLITVIVGLAAVFAILWSKDLFEKTLAVEIFHILCDGFFTVGVVITGLGLLIFSSNEGTFDIIAYGMTSFLDFFRKNKKNKYDTFYDYRLAKSEQKLGFGFMLIVGLVFLAVGLIMYLLYRRVA